MQLLLHVFGSQGQNIITSNMLISQSTWYHIAVISGTNSFDLYVNGTLAASSTSLNTFKISNDQRLTLTIGNPVNRSIDDDSYSLMCHFDKMQIPSNRSVIGVDNLRFYSRQLKVREIQALTDDDYSPSSYFFGDADHLL